MNMQTEKDVVVKVGLNSREINKIIIEKEKKGFIFKEAVKEGKTAESIRLVFETSRDIKPIY